MKQFLFEYTYDNSTYGLVIPADKAHAAATEGLGPPPAYQHCKEMAEAYRGSTTPIQLSNAIMRDLLEEFME